MTYARPLVSPLFAPRYPALRHSNPLGALAATNPAYAKTMRLTVFPETRPDPRKTRGDTRAFIPAAKLPNGLVLWEGPSKLDGAPIVVILTALVDVSGNEKTDDMIQSWIMRRDIPPHEAVRSGGDSSVCGECPKRPAIVYAGATRVVGMKKTKKGGMMEQTLYYERDGEKFHAKKGDACYVKVHNAPRQIWETYRAGGYLRVPTDTAVRLVAGRILRIGSYGDPAATPVEPWLPLIRAAKGHSGYTHQWCRPEAQVWRPYCMASTETAADDMRAHAMNWRPFRAGNEPLLEGERRCPASKEMGKILTCSTCRQCNGAGEGPTPSKRPGIVIRPH